MAEAADGSETATGSRYLKAFQRQSNFAIKVLGWCMALGLAVKYLIGYISSSAEYGQRIDRIVVSLGFFLLLGGTLVSEIKRARKEKYSNIQPHMHAIHHRLRELSAALLLNQDYPTESALGTERSHKNALVQAEFMRILDELASAFGVLTGTRCRTCIKLTNVSDDGKICTYAYARDSKSSQASRRIDLKRAEEFADPIEENEDFEEIYFGGADYYLDNDLPRRRNYRNSSEKIYGKPPSSLKWWQTLFPSLWWRWPYRAVVIWPIQQRDLTCFPLKRWVASDF